MSSTTIRFRLTVNGAATDATSVVLRDPTEAFGVRRTDTDAVVVAAGTAMEQVGTGVYEYAFEDPAAGLTYNYWVEYVYAGQTLRLERNLAGPVPLDEGSSYCTLEEADQIAAALPGLASFKAATDDARTAALLGATIDVDDSGRFQGRRYDPAQALEFPRVAYGDAASAACASLTEGAYGACVVWDLDADGEPIVPLAVKRATVYQADAILDGKLAKALDDIFVGVASESLGSMSVSYRDPAQALAAIGAGAGGGLCRQAARALARYALASGRLL